MDADDFYAHMALKCGGSANTSCRSMPRLVLVLSVSISWVGVAQIARLAEKQTELAHHSSIVPLMTCANAAMWMVLCVPHVAGKVRERRGGAEVTDGRVFDLFRSHKFQLRQPPQFLAIALTTNFCYIAALHFLPASLNTAIFCTNPIFTFLLSASWLPADVGAATSSKALGRCFAALCSRSGVHVVLSVAGVVLIAEPWDAAGASHHRLSGVVLSLLAALGTSLYQVYFKVTFGNDLRPEDVGLFLAHMGALGSTLLSAVLVATLATGVYHLQLASVPWGLVGATAAASALFNFLIKFGISVDSPVAISLATQIGIPLNLLLDVAVVHANIDGTQALGALLMLASFTMQQQRGKTVAARSDRGGRLEEALLED